MRWYRAHLHRPLLRVDMELTQPRAKVLIVLGGCMWGVYWLPLRHLEGMGFTGASAGIALYTGCLLLLLPFTLGFGAVILRGNGGIPIPSNTGDIFALLSGIFWAVGSMGLLKASEIPARVQVFGFFLGALVLSLIILGIMQEQRGAPISLSWDPIVMGYVLIYALYKTPMVFLTILPATVLPPARIGVLLMSEVVIGAISAALLSGEVFGACEALGTLLIITAALFEVLGKR